LQKRPELAAIQVVPRPFQDMVVRWYHRPALWAGPKQPFSLAGPGINHLVENVKLDPFTIQGVSKPKRIAMKLYILYDSSLTWSH